MIRSLEMRAHRLVAPIAAFALQRAVLAAAAWHAGFDPLSPTSYVRWDSAYYLDIAANGYAPIAHCAPESRYPASDWCGNAGWFPGYSFLLHLLGSSPAAAVFLSGAAQLCALVLIWILLDDRRQWPALAIAAFFAGNVYMAAVFPISLFALAALACIAALWSSRGLIAAGAASLAAASYPTGVILAPVAGAWALWRKRPAAAGAVIGALVGYAAVLAILQAQAGTWTAYFKIQAKYGYHPGLVIDALLRHLKPLVNAHYRNDKGLTTGFQTLWCAILVIAAAVRARRDSERDSLLIAYSIAFWIVPLAIGGELSLYRSEALLLPAALLVPRLSMALQCALAGTAFALSIPMAILFFKGVLV